MKRFPDSGNEAYSKYPVSDKNCIVPAFALGGCNDCVILQRIIELIFFEPVMQKMLG